jgi:hypothetical protein
MAMAFGITWSRRVGVELSLEMGCIREEPSIIDGMAAAKARKNKILDSII